MHNRNNTQRNGYTSWRSLIVVISFASMLALQHAHAQARLVLNGGTIVLQEGVYLVIDNPSPDAITHNSGGIVSESQSAFIKWNIGTTTGTYTIPWSYQAEYIPVTFTKSAGGGNGYFLLSTYHTGWQNSAELPAGIANFNRTGGIDNSSFAVDRFWQINAQDYSTKPSITDLSFTYREIEYQEPLNTINENVLTAQRWNEDLGTWTDFISASSVNSATNTVTVPEVLPEDFHPWWDVTYLSARHWIAASSSSWNEDANWSITPGGPANAAVPTSQDDVFFDDEVDEDCILDTDAVMANLTVDENYSGVFIQGGNTMDITNGATLAGGTFVGGGNTANISVGGLFLLSGATFTSTGGTLDLGGDFIFTGGTFAHHNGTVRFSGANGVTQNITGNTSAVFNNLTIANASATPGVTVQNNHSLRGVLNLDTNVTFDPDGPDDISVFTLLSTNDAPTRDAAIGILPAGAQITGNVRIQRYMSLEGPNDRRIYRYIASPLQNAAVVDIQGEIPVTGTFTGASVCQGCVTRSQSMYGYTETVITDTNGSGANDISDGYVDFPQTDNKEILLPGKGYTFFVRGDIIPSGLWDVNGIVTQGNSAPVELPVTFTSSGVTGNDGWNLVGNPYASTIDWNAATGWTRSDMDAGIYIADNGGTTARYATWNGVTGTNGGSRYIAIGQAFWVKASGTGTPVLNAAENIKAPGIQTTFFREEAPENMLRIAMVKDAVTDEAVIHFRPDATDDFDPQADTWKMMNGSFNLSMLANTNKLAINSLPGFTCTTAVNLMIEGATSGGYQLDFSSMDSFTKPTTITLVDRFTNDTTDISLFNTYAFTVTTDSASQGSERFTVYFKTPLDSVSIEQDGTTFTSSYSEGNQWYLDGRPIPGATAQSIEAVNAGTYTVTVAAGGCSTTSAGRTISITGEAEAISSAIRITPNPVINELNIEVPASAMQASEATLINSIGQVLGSIPLLEGEGKKTGRIIMSDYPTGTYIVRITDGIKRFDRKIFKQ